jgi:hypothetical protein
MWDAVTWQNLRPLPGPFAGYRDGADFAWPAQAFTELGSRVHLSITVAADERFEVFDSEQGDAGTEQVATAVANRLQDKKWSWAYSNGANLPGLLQALRRKSVSLVGREVWPKPGVYLWAAAPGTRPGTVPSWCPVSPVAVQDRWEGPFDVSTLYVDLNYTPPGVPAPPKPPVPPKPSLKEGGMRIAVATSASTSPPQLVVKPGEHYLVFDNGMRYIIENPADVTAWVASLGPVVPLTGSFLANIPTMP